MKKDEEILKLKSQNRNWKNAKNHIFWSILDISRQIVDYIINSSLYCYNTFELYFAFHSLSSNIIHILIYWDFSKYNENWRSINNLLEVKNYFFSVRELIPSSPVWMIVISRAIHSEFLLMSTVIIITHVHDSLYFLKDAFTSGLEGSLAVTIPIKNFSSSNFV